MKALFSGFFLFALVGAASAADFVEGTHYTALETPQPVTEEGKIEVLEFFSYGCPHCYEFEETLEPWATELPEDVSFRRVPAGLGRQFFQLMAVMFHVADQLGVAAQVHPVLFEEIHDKRNQAIGSRDALAAVFQNHGGISGEQFDAAVQSPEVMQAFQASEGMQQRYGLHGVPMLVVNGKYTISRNNDVPTYEKMLEVADFLIAQERG